jgi:hypothetical protein
MEVSEWSRPDRFTPGERAPGAHWTGGWVGPRAGLDAMENRKSVAFASNRTPTMQLDAIPTGPSGLHELWKCVENTSL